MDRLQIVKRLQELDLLDNSRRTAKVPKSPDLRVEATKPPLLHHKNKKEAKPPTLPKTYFTRSDDNTPRSFNRRDFLRKYNVDARPKVFLGSETLLDATTSESCHQKSALGNVTAGDLATCKRMDLCTPLHKSRLARNETYWRPHTTNE